MENGRRRRKNAKRKAAPASATKLDDVPDEVLGLVFLRLTSPRDLVRAAFTCKRWRQAIAADVLSSLHGAPSSHVVGRYRVEEGLHARRPPGSNPVFVPSSSSSSSSPWADIVAARNLGLDFLPRTPECSWEITDVRDGLLILLSPSWSSPLLTVCDPLARRYRRIPHSAWFHGYEFMGVFLLDGEDAGARISLSNFRVTCVLERRGVARACAFSSNGGGRWTSGAAPARSSTAVCGDNYWTATSNPWFAGSTETSAYWEVQSGVLALDKEAAELSLLSALPPDALRGKRHAQEYAYELPWPPTIRACLF